MFPCDPQKQNNHRLMDEHTHFYSGLFEV